MVASTMGLADPVLPAAEWDVLFTYTIDDTGAPTAFSQTGDFTLTIACSGTWSETSNTTWSTTDPDDYLEYAIDTADLQIGFANQTDGTVEHRVATCSDGVAVPLGIFDDFVIHEECNGNVEDDEGLSSSASPLALAPTQFSIANDVNDPGNDDCIVAAAASKTNDEGYLPFSGRVIADFKNQNGNVVNRAILDTLGGTFVSAPNTDFSATCTSDFCDIFADGDDFLGLPGFPSVGHYRAWTHFD